jgi:hypothetical protein
MDATIMQMPQNKLEEIADWFLYFATEEGIVNYRTIVDGDTLQIKKEIIQGFQEMKQTEDMGVILETHMETLQTHAEELFAQKDIDYHQEVDNLKTLLEEQTVEEEKTNTKMTRRIRDSGQECVTLDEEISQFQEQIHPLCEKIGEIQVEIQGMKFADCTSEGNKSEGDRTVTGEINTRKWRTSLAGDTVDRKGAGKTVMTFSLSRKAQANGQDSDREGNRKLYNRDWAHEANGGESERLVQCLSRIHRGIGKTVTSAAVWSIGEHVSCNGKQRGDIEAGILAYSELVAVEKEKLPTDADEKLLVACNDDGAIILKLIKSLLEPLSTDIKKAY